MQSNCNSLRITNCEQLIATQPRDAVINDRVCRAQCGHLLGADLTRQARLVNPVTPPIAPPQNVLPPQQLIQQPSVPLQAVVPPPINPLLDNNIRQIGNLQATGAGGGPLPPFDGSTNSGRRAPRRPGGNDFRPFRNRLNPLAALFRG